MIYLITDVLLLADALSAMREQMYEHYKLDLFRHISLPQFSRNAALLLTGQRIGLITDYDQYLFVERSIRGGLCQQSFRFVKANNAACSDYYPSQPESHIMYLHRLQQPLRVQHV